MKTSFDSIACAAIRQPSISRCGTVFITCRSLNAPGSDSSALTTTYFGFGESRAISDAFRPIGKPAPPRPRRFALPISSISASEVIARAVSSAEYPPIARYSESLVRSRSSAPLSRASSSATDLLDDRLRVLGPDVVTVPGVHGDHRRVAAPAEALDGAERDLAVLGRLAGLHAERGLERLDHALSADERTGQVRADLDHVPPDGLQVEHVVERRDRLAVRGRQLERLGHLAERLDGEPSPVPLLCEPERRQDRRARLGIAGRDLLHLPAKVREAVAGHQRSTSPMTVSSEPTIAIMSATSESLTQVAVASRATKDGARNFTRHGFGPPSETT